MPKVPRMLQVLVLLSVLFWPRHAGAVEGHQILFVPVVAHLGASGGATWVSDLRLHNPNLEDASSGLTFLRAGSDNSAAVEVPVALASGETRLIQDVLVSAFGTTDTYGAVRIRSSVPLIASSSTYLATPSPFPGTTIPYKETFQSVALDESEWSSLAFRFLFVANRFRAVEAGESVRDSSTNVGLLNPTADPIAVSLVLLDQDQSITLGGTTISLPPYGFIQIVDLFAAFSAADVRVENGLVSIGAFRSPPSPSLPAPVLAYAVRQTETFADCGGLSKQADFLLAQRVSVTVPQ